jgi:hypothetical protein
MYAEHRASLFQPESVKVIELYKKSILSREFFYRVGQGLLHIGCSKLPRNLNLWIGDNTMGRPAVVVALTEDSIKICVFLGLNQSG